MKLKLINHGLSYYIVIIVSQLRDKTYRIIPAENSFYFTVVYNGKLIHTLRNSICSLPPKSPHRLMFFPAFEMGIITFSTNVLFHLPLATILNLCKVIKPAILFPFFNEKRSPINSQEIIINNFLQC